MAAPEHLSFDDVPDPVRRAARPSAPPQPPAEPSPTRGQRRAWAVLGAAIATLWVVLATWSLGPRGDLGSVGVLSELGLWLLAGLTAFVIALHPGPRGLSLGVRALLVGLLLVPIVFVAVAIAWSTGVPDVPFGWSTLGGCVVLSTAMTAVPLLVVVLLFRRSFVTAASLRLAVLGGLAGFLGTLGCHAHCPAAHALSHVVLGHGASILVGATLGAILGALRGRA